MGGNTIGAPTTNYASGIRGCVGLSLLDEDVLESVALGTGVEVEWIESSTSSSLLTSVWPGGGRSALQPVSEHFLRDRTSTRLNSTHPSTFHSASCLQQQIQHTHP